MEEADIDKAVQVMANLLALQNCLPRLFGTLMRGMCHVGLIRSHEVDDTFSYAEKTLKGANKACDAASGTNRAAHRGHRETVCTLFSVPSVR